MVYIEDMPRIPNNRPTSIYWLFDMRTETLAQYPNGWPFYCGKTVKGVESRLRHHRSLARRQSHRPISQWLNLCGDNVRFQTMEIVPIGENWARREQYFIATIRLLYPGGANVTDGGEGTPGLVQSPEHRAKISAAHKGRKLSDEHRSKMRGRVFSPETRLKIGAAQRGRKRPPEVRAKISAGHMGKPKSIETRARMCAAQKGRTFSSEHLAKLSAVRRGRVHTPEHRAKIEATRLKNMRARGSVTQVANARN